eukprot:9736066-Ditylum_brightwellii.AAC.1
MTSLSAVSRKLGLAGMIYFRSKLPRIPAPPTASCSITDNQNRLAVALVELAFCSGHPAKKHGN